MQFSFPQTRAHGSTHAVLDESIAAMWPYILTTVAVALFPLALAGYGGHLAAIALPADSKARRKALFLVWGLATMGILLFAMMQVIAYRSDKNRDQGEEAFRNNVLNKLQAIIHEPDVTKRKADASSLDSSIRAGAAKRVQPSRSNSIVPVNPRLAVVNEANDLADKIDNIGDDYGRQIEAEMQKQNHLPPDVAAHEKPSSDARMDGIREYERNRYAIQYREKAIAVRTKMLEEIPDIPIYAQPTTEAHWTYENPYNGLGFKEVAKNLRELASAYKMKVELTSSKQP